MNTHSLSRVVKQGETYRLQKEPVTTRQLVMYAGASGDYNPIHYDLPHAQSAGIGGVIAHGMLTMAFAGQCVSDWAGPSARIADIGGRFLKPVRPGDIVEMIATVRTIQDGGLCALDIDGRVGENQVFAGQAQVHLAGQCTKSEPSG